MPVHRNPEAALPILLGWLSEAERSIANSNSENSSRIKELFKSVEDGLEFMKPILPSLQGWEESMIMEFRELVREIRDGVYKNGDSSEEMRNRPSISESNLRSIEEKIRTINDQLSIIDSKTKALLRRKTDKQPAGPAPKDEAKKAASKHWQELRMEEYILASSTISSLTLSYEAVEERLKPCLRCFSIFTDNTVIKKRPLIYWWIGEGFVTAKDNNTADDEGEHVFQELMKKGMIKPHNEKMSPAVSSCTLHPWIRRMLISAAKEAEFFDFDMTKATPPTSFRSSRRACLVSEDHKGGSSVRKEVEKEIPNPEELQTLFNVNEQYLKFDRHWLSKATNMIVLHLGRWHDLAKHHIEVADDEFMKGLETQKNLKYLSLRGISRIMELPDSIGKLENLAILDLRACHNLGRLPTCIGSLKKLTHLDVSECYLLESMPKELEKLSGLQVLKGFVVHSSSGKDSCDLRKLAEWPNLKKLSIYMGSAVENQEDELSNLSDFKALRILTISWGGRSIEFKRAIRQLSKKESMTKKSSPSIPPSLQKLDLRCFPRTVAPDWLGARKLLNLEKLYIRGGKLRSLYVPEDQGVRNVVTTLRLKHLKDMQIQWTDVESAFPNLTYFEKVKCEGFSCDDCAEMRDDGVWRKEGAGTRWTNVKGFYAAGSSSTANISSIIDPRSDSLVNVSGIYGLDDQVKDLETLLLQNGGSDKMKTIGIVGMGGAGKTTLAQLVFNSPNVQSVYFPRIWICLSTTYNKDPDAIKSRLVEYMMEQLGEDEDTLSFLIDGNGGCGLDQLLLGLCQRLQGKRYLIVLDDVRRISDWYEGLAVPELDEHSQHTESGHRLTYGLPKSHGGGIIVTSRLEEVAKGMVGETNLYRLQPLEDTDIWSIIIQTAENQGREFNKSDLTNMKDEIVENCGGLPSAAQALGKIIPSKFNRDNQRSATESEAANQIVQTGQLGEFGGP